MAKVELSARGTTRLVGRAATDTTAARRPTGQGSPQSTPGIKPRPGRAVGSVLAPMAQLSQKRGYLRRPEPRPPPNVLAAQQTGRGHRCHTAAGASGALALRPEPVSAASGTPHAARRRTAPAVPTRRSDRLGRAC